MLNLLSNSKIKVACFIEPDFNQIDSLKSLGIKILEFHTGSYADSKTKNIMEKHLSLIRKSVEYATGLGIDCHAGHGLNYDNVYDIAAIKNIKEITSSIVIESSKTYIKQKLDNKESINLISKSSSEIKSSIT